MATEKFQNQNDCHFNDEGDAIHMRHMDIYIYAMDKSQEITFCAGISGLQTLVKMFSRTV